MLSSLRLRKQDKKAYHSPEEHLHVLVEEVEKDLIPLLIRRLHFIVL